MANTPAKKGTSTLIAVLAIIVIAGMFFIYRLNNENEALKKTNSDLQARSASSDSILNQIKDEQKLLADSNTVVVNMVGTKAAPRSSANVYWDSTNASVFLVVKNMEQLPANESQYQLWALIDGKPSDLGVFDAKSDKVMLKMKDTKKADAFAITIEKKGGNPSPTLEKMQSLGKTKGL